MQFLQWTNALRRERRDVSDFTTNPSGKVEQEVPVFTTETKSLVHIKTLGWYYSNPGNKRLEHMSVADSAIHFWKDGILAVGMLQMLQHTARGKVNSCIAVWTNMTTNSPLLTSSETVYRPPGGDQVRHPSMRMPERKSEPLMRDLVEKYSRSGSIATDVIVETFSTARACLSLNQHRRFNG